AYLRYTGKVYLRAQVARLYLENQNYILAVISALYGLLDGKDPIRNYELVMNATLPTGTRLATWWKNHGLGKIVEEYILAIKPMKVHDLLSGVYRNALDPWPPKSFRVNGIEYCSYEYPGEGTGSLWHRGDDLKKLLST
ncbi:MAG: peroxide stress protein YaaA, partial [Anaerolineaceae bacterium]|nr:peroxide stress protein YaaA [Anaerolineaceae bacterium]